MNLHGVDFSAMNCDTSIVVVNDLTEVHYSIITFCLKASQLYYGIRAHGEDTIRPRWHFAETILRVSASSVDKMSLQVSSTATQNEHNHAL